MTKMSFKVGKAIHDARRDKLTIDELGFVALRAMENPSIDMIGDAVKSLIGDNITAEQITRAWTLMIRSALGKIN